MAEPRKFRLNPVEAVIFAAVFLIFSHSVYHLFQDPSGLQMTALSPMAANPVTEGRTLASTSSSFTSINLSCEQNPETSTTASKIRITGDLCGTVKNSKDSPKLLRAQIQNQSSKDVATVFSDVNNGVFSTDYIRLNSGKNEIHIEFMYANGKTFAQNLVINKN